MADLSAADLRVRRARAAMLALKHVGEDMLGESQRRAPVEEGTLRASAALAFIVNGVRFEGGGAFAAATAAAVTAARTGILRTIDVEVSFNTVYAARQHEETEWHHPKGGQSKYLESVVRERHVRYTRALELADRAALS